MTDKELSTFGEKLYGAILETPLPSGRIFALAGAIRQGVTWAKLPPPLKIAVFKIAARCLETSSEGTGVAAEAPESPASVAAGATTASDPRLVTGPTEAAPPAGDVGTEHECG